MQSGRLLIRGGDAGQLAHQLKSFRQKGPFSPASGATGDWREWIGIVDAQNGPEVAALAAKVEELSRVCARLSRENVQLHGMVA